MTAESTTVILAVFERADALDLVLRAFADQDEDTFDVLVADDGSGPDVAACIERWRSHLDVRHAWQPNEGFRKARALNLAALAASNEYLLFLDGDCVPRQGFMRAIRRARQPGWFLTTKRVQLGEGFTRRVLEQQVPIWRWSTLRWFLRAPRELGRPGYLLPVRDRRRPWRPRQPEFVPPVSAYCLFDVRREDFERVNGYDSRCVRSNDGEDQDLAIRLRRSGLRCGWPGSAATVLHLWHAERTDKCRDREAIFRETQAGSHVDAVIGLRELARERERGQVSAKRVSESSSSSEPVNE